MSRLQRRFNILDRHAEAAPLGRPMVGASARATVDGNGAKMTTCPQKRPGRGGVKPRLFRVRRLFGRPAGGAAPAQGFRVCYGFGTGTPGLLEL